MLDQANTVSAAPYVRRGPARPRGPLLDTRTAFTEEERGPLLALSFFATTLHYVDNVLHLKEYPDLPATRPEDIILFWIFMMPFGIIGYRLYTTTKHRISYYLVYIYCFLNMVVLGHYLPSRMSAMTSPMTLKIHFFILFEAATALILMIHVGLLHRRASSTAVAMI